ncbi:MAG TPA: ABC transporter permease, partial [Chthoniobacterales bacterium]|nr:ABC transporter permease [Chthoniobacterales bacterium]
MNPLRRNFFTTTRQLHTSMFFHSFLQDIRIGLRVLFKEKTFSILAVTVLALGICGVTTQFAIVNGTVLRGFSLPNPEQLVSVGLIDPQKDENGNNGGAGFVSSAQDYEDIRAAQQSYSMMAHYLSNGTINVTHKGAPQRYTGAQVTDDFFRIIGVSPVLGREFTADDHRPGAEKVALLSDEIWQHDFGGDPNVVGQAIRINGKPATV